MDAPFDSRYLCWHLIAAAICVAAAITFVIAICLRKTILATISSLVLVLGPALYYPVSYFLLWRVDIEEAKFVVFLANIWGPLWVAISGACITVWVEFPPWRKRSALKEK
jgi:hypothetical protein